MDDCKEGLSAGAAEYIVKPFDRDLLKLKISNLLQLRNKIREQYKRMVLTEPDKIRLQSKTDKFIEKVMKLILDNLNNPDFKLEQFASDLGMSEIQLNRKLNSIIGKPPVEMVRMVRMKQAAQLLKEASIIDMNVSEIAYMVGYTNTSHFSQVFKKYYQMSPTQYMESVND
jgi:AraC-like DNA-binding protein